MLLISCLYAADLPLPGDKHDYRVAATVGAGAEPEGVVSPRLLWAPTRRSILSAGATWTMETNEVLRVVEGDHVDNEWVVREAYWAPELGYSFNVAADGMEGWGPGVRLDAGILHYTLADESRQDLARARASGFIWGRWVGHPGLLLGAELGVTADVCCGRVSSEPPVAALAMLELGTALPWGPAPAAVNAQLPPERLEAKRHRARAIGLLLGAGTAVIGGWAIHEQSQIRLTQREISQGL
ncbi:MAG: hypothetical protein FJ102_00535 [Deltaproteobacteria bacterium]|nr:hypothetical protein [Deltaproteobacteria bacterium]